MLMTRSRAAKCLIKDSSVGLELVSEFVILQRHGANVQTGTFGGSGGPFQLRITNIMSTLWAIIYLLKLAI
jgi:hypothetical protein